MAASDDICETWYRAIKSATEPGMVLVSGDCADRLSGLVPAYEFASGSSVLDIGCYEGAILASFARRGAAILHGVDVYQPGLAASREALRPFQGWRVERCDLTGGIAAVEQSLAPMPLYYDIVLYLGVHHHLVRQMPPSEAASLAVELMRRARVLFAVRTTPEHYATLRSLSETAGLELWHEADNNPNVGPLRIYRRIDGG